MASKTKSELFLLKFYQITVIRLEELTELYKRSGQGREQLYQLESLIGINRVFNVKLRKMGCAVETDTQPLQ